MLKIRLQRVGRKHDPAFRIVLTESQNAAKSGKFHEILGSYDPRVTDVNLDTERISYWMGKGAQVSPTVHNILINQNVISGEKKNVSSTKAFRRKEAEVPKDDSPETSSSEEVSLEAKEEVKKVEAEVKAPESASEAKASEGLPKEGGEEQTPTEEPAPASPETSQGGEAKEEAPRKEGK